MNIHDPLSELCMLPAPVAARGLLGRVLERQLPSGVVRGVITETEAYLRDDEASHSFRGRMARNASMFGPPAHAYVYLSYGLHSCLNVVTGEEGRGEAVLIRSLDIIEGETLAEANRSGRKPVATGPGNLCQALGIGLSCDGHDLRVLPLRIVPGISVAEGDILTGPRIGIRKAADLPYRFCVRGFGAGRALAV